jgi:ATP-dependent 26S proteasome regulatory subunit
MGDDQFFLDFILGDKDILIIEDADTMILDRDKDNNTLLAKILNVSDGLIKNINKKIVFSTNITDKNRIDSALMRPGRCFDVMDFRALTYEEAVRLQEATGATKELNPNKEYTLAELMSQGNRETKKAFKFGFHS